MCRLGCVAAGDGCLALGSLSYTWRGPLVIRAAHLFVGPLMVLNVHIRRLAARVNYVSVLELRPSSRPRRHVIAHLT